jgi:hypothetical protein
MRSSKPISRAAKTRLSARITSTSQASVLLYERLKAPPDIDKRLDMQGSAIVGRQ